MPSTFPIMPPGITTGKVTGFRVVFRQRGERYLAQGLTIDGSKARDPGNVPVTVLRPGLLLGRITSGGKLGASVIGTLTSAIAAGATSMAALAPMVTELVRRVGATGTFKLTGPAVANGPTVTETITYSAASGTTITVTATVNAFVAGSFIQPSDGSETPITFVDDLVGGIQVVDDAGADMTSVDCPRAPVSGVIDSSQLIPWSTDTSLQNWIIARLNDGAGGQYVFDHRYVG